MTITEWALILTAVTGLMTGMVAAIKGLVAALRWWADREQERITHEILGQQAIATVEDKNRELQSAHQAIDRLGAELASVKDQLRACLQRNGAAS